MYKTLIWGRDFELKVVYDCYAGEEILPLQKDAFEEFSNNAELLSSSLSDVKKYCIEENQDDIGSDQIENIFKYVMPESIYVKRDGRVALICRYKFDAEHGIAVVFNGGKLEEVGSQDIETIIPSRRLFYV